MEEVNDILVKITQETQSLVQNEKSCLFWFKDSNADNEVIEFLFDLVPVRQIELWFRNEKMCFSEKLI